MLAHRHRAPSALAMVFMLLVQHCSAAAAVHPVQTSGSRQLLSTGGPCGSSNGGVSCGGGQCCSKYGWCGVTDEHCGSGCQSAYGQCGTQSEPSPEPREPSSESSTLSIKANTLKPDKDGRIYFWVEPLATALLAEGTAGLIWGTIPAEDVNAACDLIVSTGSYDIPASITGYGHEISTTLRVSALGGCRAGDKAPVGVQAVFEDDKGRKSAVICTDRAWELGCNVYLTGEDVESLSKQLSSPGGRRKALSTPMAPSRRLLQSGGPCGSNNGGASCGSQCCSQYGWCGVTSDHCGTGCQGGYGSCGSPGGSTLRGITNDDIGTEIGCAAGTVASVATGVGAAIGCTAITFLTFGLGAACYAAAVGVAAGGSVGSCVPEMEENRSEGGCFPAHATAQLCDGRQARMDELSLGDMLAVRRADDTLGCEPIYAWGHQDASATTQFVRITLAPADTAAGASANVTLELTPGHFVPVSVRGGQALYKRAGEVAVGDTMWVAAHDALGHLSLATVVAVGRTQSRGMYNPFTLSGNLVVNGALASAHSEWFCDTAFDALRMPTSWLPAVYQVALAPVRLLWHMLGREVYISLYTRLDAQLDFAAMCSASGGWGLLGIAYAVARAVPAASAGMAMHYAGAALAATVGVATVSMVAVVMEGYKGGWAKRKLV